MVSAHEKQNIDNVMRPQPISVRSVPECYQDKKTFRSSRFECIVCDFFENCKKAKS
ncbi:MAG: hypothetical protein ACTSPQ_15285 [Candidatus Helarchaeota archaeon]